MTFYLISNMYPTQETPGYGSFVKNVCDALSSLGVTEKYRSVIKGRAKSKIEKIRKYINFYFSICLNYWRKYDFLYVHFPNQAVPLLYLLLFIKKRKLVVNLHGEDLVYPSSGYGYILGKWMEKMCRKYADIIVVPSEYFKDIVRSRHIIKEERIIVSPSGGINPNIFYPKEKIVKNEILHLGYVGRMEKDKGIVEFLEACKKLQELKIAYKATAIGYGSLYEKAKEYIIENHLSDITLIPGLAQKELGKYYRSFDLLLFNSSAVTGESLGLTGIEAMACGTPVVGSNIGGIASYVKPNFNGWLVSCHDINNIVESINEYIDLPIEKKSQLSINSVQTGKEYYSPKVCKKLKYDICSIFNNDKD